MGILGSSGCVWWNASLSARFGEGALQQVVLFWGESPNHDSWDRSGEVNRGVFQKKIVADLRLRKIPVVRVGGTLAERIRSVEEVLKDLVV